MVARFSARTVLYTPSMTQDTFLSRFTPRSGTRAQLFSAAVVWAVGATILILRGIGYVHDRHWHAWALGAALVLGVVKARYLLDGVANKAVARVFVRGRACYFGFFSWKSWLLVGLMMGGGITLRHLIVHPGVVGAGIMGALYIGIGTALALADRIFWTAAFGGLPGAQVTGGQTSGGSLTGGTEA